MRDIQGMQLTFKKSDLTAFGDGELKIILVFAAISNRLKLLETQTFGHWATAKDASRPEHTRSAALCGVVEFLILLAGELKEAWESIQQCYYGTQVSRSLHSTLPANVQEAMKRCGRHFVGTALTTYLRNNFANHNNVSEMLKIARALDEAAEFSFSLFPHDNKYFEYATKVRLAAIADHLKLRDWEWDQVVRRMVAIIVKEVYSDIHAALNGVLSQLLSTVTLQRQPEILARVRKWNEFPCEYFFFIESPLP
jgi:hypothetical protein